ncbi:hypothetical protein LWI28_022662 [Acer negundo]|uniref:FAD-binding domain-containing protein n=1 Tax=Acer negundo TaxID=4023 RepID=A0AAD5IMX2_ACENE|nr:hypothetical protein LWI28_022662 [Acer negundo]
MDLANRFNNLFHSILSMIIQLLPAPPPLVDCEAVIPVDPDPNTNNSDQENLDWAMRMICFCLPPAVAIAIQFLENESHELPLAFHFLSLVLILSFNFLFLSKFVAPKFPETAKLLERVGVFLAFFRRSNGLLGRKTRTKTYPFGYIQNRALSDSKIIDSNDTVLPVLIVGGGPAGLVLSILLTKLPFPTLPLVFKTSKQQWPFLLLLVLIQLLPTLREVLDEIFKVDRAQLSESLMNESNPIGSSVFTAFKTKAYIRRREEPLTPVSRRGSCF